MILSGKSIQDLITQKKLVIEPNPEIKEASVKIHFAHKVEIKPKQFLVTTSKEVVEMPENLAGLYDGYTHLSRRGVITHLGSMFVDPGMKGHITLEMFNASDEMVVIEAGDRAGHLIFLEVK